MIMVISDYKSGTLSLPYENDASHSSVHLAGKTFAPAG